LKDRECDKEASQNSCPEQATLVQAQGASEDENFEKGPTLSKTDFSDPFSIALCILGVTGKMGACLLSVACKDPSVRIVSGTGRPCATAIGKDLGSLLGNEELGVCIQDNAKQALAHCSVAVDFSVHEAVLEHVCAAREAKKALLIGTTGLSDKDLRAIEEASRVIPIALSSNFSLGIALCLEAACAWGGVLFGRSTIDIHETHHVHKKDRPSGTALSLARAIGKGKIVSEGFASPRNFEEIAIYSTRHEEVVGEHRLVFDCGQECIEIKHVAHSREAFAQGALIAAKALAAKPAGLYAFKDLYGN
jgi:4-hydroxy-tetrahydrodipicolinate reductase